jgi:predicted NBD/HSP70 family sugar kinase
VRCSCGKRHCWEAYASDRAAVARYLAGTQRPRIPKDAVTLTQLVEWARRGEPEAVAAIEETAWYLGLGIANLNVGLSPQEIVVCGEIASAWPLIAAKVEEPMGTLLSLGLQRTPIIASSLGRRATLVGALSLVLSRKFAVADSW